MVIMLINGNKDGEKMGYIMGISCWNSMVLWDNIGRMTGIVGNYGTCDV